MARDPICDMDVDEATALAYVAGYTILNDVSDRSWQRRQSQWAMGKSLRHSIIFASANSTSVVTKIGAKAGILHKRPD